MFGTTHIEYTWMSPPNYVDSRINIYELAHKCKEWAFANGWYLWIEWKSGGNFCVKIAKDETTIFGVTEFYDWSEQEAIFKACEQILEREGSQC